MLQGGGEDFKETTREEVKKIMMVAFQAYRRTLVAVSEFKYLGRVITASYDNWTAVVGNLRKVQKQWARMSRVLGWEGADHLTAGNNHQGGGASDTGIVGDFPSDWEDPWRIVSQGDPQAGNDAAEEGNDSQVGLSATGSGNEESGTEGGGCVHPPPPEYRRQVYCHSDDYRDKSEGGATAGGAVVNEMVGAIRTRPRSGRDGDGNRDRYEKVRGV